MNQRSGLVRRGAGRAFVAAALFVGLLSVQPFGFAQEAPTATSPSKPKPGEVEVEHSRVYVFVDKTGLGHQHGVEARLVSGTLALGATENAGRLVFDMKSFDADTDRARQYVGLSGSTDPGTRSAVNTNMRGSAILDVNRYPTAAFDISSAAATGRQGPQGLPIYSLQGRFTLHGKTRPLAIDVEAEQVRGWWHVRGNFVIRQTDFGITPYSKAFGAIGVADPLRIFGDLFVAPTDSVASAGIPVRQ